MKRKYASRLEQWAAVRRELSAGASVRAAAERAGVSRMTAWRLGRAESPGKGMLPMPKDAAATGLPASPGSRLTYGERAAISALSGRGLSAAAIARALGRSPSTVSRELGRCPPGEYDPRRAHLEAFGLARRPKARRVDSDPRLRAYVVGGLARRWSPRQISARMAADHPDDEAMRLSHEAIYRAIYVQGRGALRDEVRVEAALRRGGSARRPRSKMPARPRGKSWVEGCEISARPPEAADRAVPGHWEGDLVVGPGGGCLVTLVERKTRFLVARRLDEHTTRTVVDLLVGMVGALPDAVRAGLLSTLTWDQGCEMADAARFTAATGFRVYFCDPRSPWQRGTNENTNGLIRQYFPKGTDFRRVSDGEVARMQDELNGRPRETLGWRTPAEAIQFELAKANGALTG